MIALLNSMVTAGHPRRRWLRDEAWEAASRIWAVPQALGVLRASLLEGPFGVRRSQLAPRRSAVAAAGLRMLTEQYRVQVTNLPVD